MIMQNKKEEGEKNMQREKKTVHIINEHYLQNRSFIQID